MSLFGTVTNPAPTPATGTPAPTPTANPGFLSRIGSSLSSKPKPEPTFIKSTDGEERLVTPDEKEFQDAYLNDPANANAKENGVKIECYHIYRTGQSFVGEAYDIVYILMKPDKNFYLIQGGKETRLTVINPVIPGFSRSFKGITNVFRMVPKTTTGGKKRRTKKTKRSKKSKKARKTARK